MMKTVLNIACGVAFGLLFQSGASLAQGYPSKPVRMLIGNAPGGPTDISLRGMAQVLSQALQQPFLVENRPGANGMIAGEACARAAPDGHTLCMADSFNTALNPVLYRTMPYSPLKDLAPVIHTGSFSASIWVASSVPANSIAELLALAKAKPGAISWATFGNSSSSHLYVEWFRNVKGIDFMNVPYKSPANAWQAVLAGEAHVAVFSTVVGLRQVKTGKVKMLTVSADTRLPSLPEIPTLKESGFDFAIVVWVGLFAPSATPKAIVQRINAEVAKRVFGDPAIRDKYLVGPGFLLHPPAGERPEAFAAFIGREHDMYSRIVQAAKVKVE